MAKIARGAFASLMLAGVGFIAVSQIALAHPLGNFTVNHYARVELTGDALRVRYVLDLAEIPSVQETRAADTDADGSVSPAEWDAYRLRKVAEIAQQLELTVDNQKVALQPTDTLVSQPMGQGDIPLVRVEAWFKAAGDIAPNVQHQAMLRDRSDPARIGWREMVVHAGAGAALADSSVPAQDVTDELRAYPDDLLQNPLDRRSAQFAFSMDGSSSASANPAASAAGNRPTDPFAALVTAADLSPAVILLALLGAAILGGMHAASPGHGKSVMAAYIVGTRGTVLHAMALALSVTLAHTTGVLVLGILTVVASNVIFPERLYPWLTLVSGAVVLVIGATFLIRAARGQSVEHDHDHGGHDHHHGDHGHTHSHAESQNLSDPPPAVAAAQHGHAHRHAESHSEEVSDHPQAVAAAQHVHQRGLAPTWRSLFALGLAGGIVPSGSALVVLLSSVALGRLGFGLVLIVAFGLGMAVVLVTTGVLLVHAGRLMLRLFPDRSDSVLGQRLTAALPVISAAIMTALGGVATVEGLIQIGALGT